MKVLVASDKFKGSLTAKEVGEVVGEAVCDICPGSDIEILPLADGGEGTLDALFREGDSIVNAEVYGPLFGKTEAKYLKSGDTAVIEMAESSGLMKVSREERNPELTSSYGFGQLIYHAYCNYDIRKFLLGIGGSATNDCGIGMLTALGIRFLDEDGHCVYPIGASLGRIRDIGCGAMFRGIRECEFTVMNDVSNPLLGVRGATGVYAPQKGADSAMVERLEKGARNFVDIIKKISGKYVGDLPGGGAAGGVGMALEHFLGASMEGGAAYILRKTHAAEKIHEADIVITGEGSVDAQTLHGKLVSEVVSLAKAGGKRCYVFCGVTKDGADSRMLGVDGLYSLADKGITEQYAITHARELLGALVRKTFRELFS